MLEEIDKITIKKDLASLEESYIERSMRYEKLSVNTDKYLLPHKDYFLNLANRYKEMSAIVNKMWIDL